MKNFILIIFVFFFISCKKEDTLSSISTENNGTQIDVEITSATKADSIIVTDIEYKNWKSFPDQPQFTAQFDTNVPHLYIIAFYLNGKPYTNDKELWLNNGNPKVKLHFKDKKVVIDTVANSLIYYEYFSFIKKLDSLDTDNDSISRNKYLLNKIEEHFNDSFSNLVAANYLGYNRSNSKNLKILLSKIEKQSSDIKNSNSSVYTQLKQLLTTKKFNLSEYSLINTNGDTIKPIIKQDKLYLIDFWFVRCLPCAADHKLIQQRINDFKKHNIEVVGIAKENSFKSWDNYLKKHNYNWTNYKEMIPFKTNPSDSLGIDVYPTYVIVNSKGEVASKHYNYVKDVFEDYLDK